MNIILLCHGGLKEFSSFDLAEGQTVQYRGNYGTPLSASVAPAIVKALISDPYMSDQHLAANLQGYKPLDPLEGPNTFAPDIKLQGADDLLCFIMNMSTGKWLPLNSQWSSTLSNVISKLGSKFWLNLLCCTNLPSANVQSTVVKSDLRVSSWAEVLKS